MKIETQRRIGTGLLFLSAAGILGATGDASITSFNNNHKISQLNGQVDGLDKQRLAIEAQIAQTDNSQNPGNTSTTRELTTQEAIINKKIAGLEGQIGSTYGNTVNRVGGDIVVLIGSSVLGGAGAVIRKKT